MPQGMLPGQVPYQMEGHAPNGPYQQFSGMVGSPQQMYQLHSSTSQPTALHLLHQQAQPHTPNRNSTYFPPNQSYGMPYGQQPPMAQDPSGGYGIYEHQQPPMYPPQASVAPSGAILSPPFNQSVQGSFDEFSAGAVPNANAFRLHQPNVRDRVAGINAMQYLIGLGVLQSTGPVSRAQPQPHQLGPYLPRRGPSSAKDLDDGVQERERRIAPA